MVGSLTMCSTRLHNSLPAHLADLAHLGVAALQDLNLSLVRGETLKELVTRASERSEPVASFLDLLVSAFYRARYSDQDVQPRWAIASRDAYRSLVAAVKTEIESKQATHSRAVTIKETIRNGKSFP